MRSTEEKSLRVIEFSVSAKDWEIWSGMFKARGKRKRYTKLLLWHSGIFTQARLTAAEEGKPDKDKKVTQLGNLNELGYEDLIFHQWGDQGTSMHRGSGKAFK